MLRVFEGFAGLGAWKKALERLNIEHEVVGFAENDPYPAKMYCLIHNEPEEKNLGDITKANETYENLDLFCYSPPCQSFSVAGKREGFEDSRGILFFDALRLIKNSKPKYCVMENVKGLTQNKFKNEFKEMLDSLDMEGYNNYWKILNSKHFNIPQNRERVFIVSVRKDIDDGSFEFPEPVPLEHKLISILQDDPDDKYYISKQMEQYIENKKLKKHNFRVEISDPNGIKESPLRARGDSPLVYDPKEVKGCSLRTRSYMGQPQQLEVRKDEVSNAVTTVTKDFMILEDFYANRDVREYKEVSPTIRSSRQGLKVKQILEDDAELPILHNIYGGFKEKEPRTFDEYSPTIRTAAGGGHIPSVCTNDDSKVEKIVGNYRIRKLTTLETMRLMDFDDEDYHKLKEAKFSDTRIYKACGNSIVVGVAEEIFKKLLKDYI